MTPESKLTKKNDFEKTARYGKFFSSNLILLKVLPNSLPKSRIGISVGLKFSKKAVERNRIKRQIREIIRLNTDKIKAGFDVVVMVSSGKEHKIESQVIEKELTAAFKKAKLID